MELKFQAWRMENQHQKEQQQNRIEENQKKTEALSVELDARMDQRFDQFMEVLKKLGTNKEVPSATSGKGLLETPKNFELGEPLQGADVRQNHFHNFPKVELQFFEGQNSKSWIRKCQKYFDIYQILESQKLEIVAIYLERRADIWFQGFLVNKEQVSWQEFVHELCHRYENKGFEDTVGKFNKLKQLGSVKSYQER